MAQKKIELEQLIKGFSAWRSEQKSRSSLAKARERAFVEAALKKGFHPHTDDPEEWAFSTYAASTAMFRIGPLRALVLFCRGEEEARDLFNHAAFGRWLLDQGLSRSSAQSYVRAMRALMVQKCAEDLSDAEMAAQAAMSGKSNAAFTRWLEWVDAGASETPATSSEEVEVTKTLEPALDRLAVENLYLYSSLSKAQIISLCWDDLRESGSRILVRDTSKPNWSFKLQPLSAPEAIRAYSALWKLNKPASEDEPVLTKAQHIWLKRAKRDSQ